MEKVETTKSNKWLIVVIVVCLLVILGCGGYLIHSYRMTKKYDVNSFKLGKYELPTFNSAIKSKKKLMAVIEEKDKITLKYDISKAKLNDVYAYLEKLSSDGFVVVNLEDTYIRSIHREKDIQVRVRTSSNHLIFEYTLGIDYSEPDDNKKNENKEKEETKKEDGKESSKIEEKKE